MFLKRLINGHTVPYSQYLRPTTCDFREKANCSLIVTLLENLPTLITLFSICQIFNIAPTIVVLDLYLQIRHEYHDDLRIYSFIGDHWKNMHFCGIAANRKHIKHSLSTFEGIISHIHSNMWSEMVRRKKPFSLKYVQNRGNLIN